MVTDLTPGMYIGLSMTWSPDDGSDVVVVPAGTSTADIQGTYKVDGPGTMKMQFDNSGMTVMSSRSVKYYANCLMV